jgi:hypothetical protein
MRFQPTRSQLKVFSTVCSDFAVAFLFANFATTEPLTLTFNIVAAILFLYLAVKAEDTIKNYD